MTTLRDKMASLPAERQAKIKERATLLIAEETSLRQLREAHRKTQVKVAQTLGIGQEGISRLERRSDMLISTLREYISALGGSMRLIVEFEGSPQIELQNLGTLSSAPSDVEVSIEIVAKPRKRTAFAKPIPPQSSEVS